MRSSRLTPETYRRITLFALLALCFIIVTGAAVRLTGSGLGCTDWPTCEHDKFVPDLEIKPMIEYVNRLITGLVSLAVAMAVLGSMRREPRRRDLTLLSWGLVAGVAGQIVLGGITVLFHLRPQLVMSHFIVSMILVWTAVVLHHRAGEADGPKQPAAPPALVTLSRWLVGLAAVVVFTGTVVTSTGPHGGDTRAVRFDLPITTVTRIHSVTAWVLLAGTLLALWLLHRSGAPDRLVRPARILLAILMAQGAVGYVQYATGVPALVVSVHIVGATSVWVAVLNFALHLREVRPHGDADPSRDPAVARA